MMQRLGLCLVLKLNLHVYNMDIVLKLMNKNTKRAALPCNFNSFIFGGETQD